MKLTTIQDIVFVLVMDIRSHQYRFIILISAVLILVIHIIINNKYYHYLLIHIRVPWLEVVEGNKLSSFQCRILCISSQVFALPPRRITLW